MLSPPAPGLETGRRTAGDGGPPAARVVLAELPWRTLALVRHRDRYRSPASRAFEETAVAVCAGLASAA